MICNTDIIDVWIDIIIITIIVILIWLKIRYVLRNKKNCHCYLIFEPHIFLCRKAKYRSTAFTKYFSFYREIKKKENCKLQKLSPTETLQTECKKSFGGAKKNEEETFSFFLNARNLVRRTKFWIRHVA